MLYGLRDAHGHAMGFGVEIVAVGECLPILVGSSHTRRAPAEVVRCAEPGGEAHRITRGARWIVAVVVEILERERKYRADLQLTIGPHRHRQIEPMARRETGTVEPVSPIAIAGARSCRDVGRPTSVLGKQARGDGRDAEIVGVAIELFLVEGASAHAGGQVQILVEAPNTGHGHSERKTVVFVLGCVIFRIQCHVVVVPDETAHREIP